MDDSDGPKLCNFLPTDGATTNYDVADMKCKLTEGVKRIEATHITIINEVI